MVVDANWRCDLERWLEPFLAGLSHPARRKTCPLYIAGFTTAHRNTHLSMSLKGIGIVGRDAVPWGILGFAVPGR